MSQHEGLVSRLADLAAEPVSWLWPGRLAAGKLALIDGDPNQGKSLLTLDLAARFSTGQALPDGYRPEKPAPVLLMSGEDGIEDTIMPRLQAAGADLSRVHVFKGRRHGQHWRLPTFPDDGDLLQQIIRDTGAQLVVADPFLAFLGNHLSALNDQMVRQALTPLAGTAEATRAAIVLVRHLNKGGNGQRAIYRGSGSIAFIGSARTAFLVGRDPEEPDLHLFACTKNNLGSMPPALGYRIERGEHGQPRVAWAGEVEVSADEVVLACPRKYGEAVAQAATFLHDLLRLRPASREEVYRRARATGIADRTLERARAQLQIVSQQCKRQDQHLFYWCLPEDAARYTPDNWDDRHYHQQLALKGEQDRLTAHLRQFDKPLPVVRSP